MVPSAIFKGDARSGGRVGDRLWSLDELVECTTNWEACYGYYPHSSIYKT
jgi:hypothetical protein